MNVTVIVAAFARASVGKLDGEQSLLGANDLDHLGKSPPGVADPGPPSNRCRQS